MKEYLRPSASDIWLNCPASVGNSVEAEKNGIIDYESDYAKEGTMAHDLAFYLLTDKTVDFKDYPIAMVNYVIPYVDYVERLTNNAFHYGYEFRGEYKLISGQCDAYALIRETLHIIDLKYGENLYVNPYQNKQLMTYAIIVKHHLENTEDNISIRNVALHVYQPRMDNIAVSVVAIEELEKFQQKLDETVNNIIHKKGLYYQMGSHCTFCKGVSECSELKELIFKIITTTIGGINLISQEDKVKIVVNKSFITKQIKKIETELTDSLRRGIDVKGIKLINGRKSYQWNEAQEEVELINKLKDYGLDEKEIIKKEVHSPAKIKEKVGKHVYQDMMNDGLINITFCNAKLVPIDAKGEDLTRNQDKDIDLLNFTTEGK